MPFKDYEYEMVDGHHFPDANKGDDVQYLFPIKTNVIINLMEYSFILPEGVTVSDSYYNGSTGVVVKLLTPKVGTFTIVCVATISVGAKRIVDHISRVIKVY